MRYACRLAERLALRLHLLHVLSEILPAGPDPLLMPVMPPQFYEENEDGLRTRSSSLLECRLGQTPVGGDGRCEWGSPVDAIVSYAIDHRIDLIVIATHGRTGLSHVLLGSVAERIVREAPCPVLTIRENSRSRTAAP